MTIFLPSSDGAPSGGGIVDSNGWRKYESVRGSQPLTAMFDYTYAEVPADLAIQRAQALALDARKA